MRDGFGIVDVRNRIPVGVVRLLLLAGLICLAVFEVDAGAGEATAIVKPNDGETEYEVTKGDKTDSFPGLEIGRENGDASRITIKDGYLISTGVTEVVGDTELIGMSLDVGSSTPKAGDLTTQSLKRTSDEATLRFKDVTVHHGSNTVDLGSSSNDRYTSALYVGGDYADAEKAKGVLNAQNFSIANSGADLPMNSVALDGDAVLADGGLVKIDANVDGRGSLSGKTFRMSGGTVDMTYKYGGEIRFDDIELGGGAVNLSAEKTDGDWTRGPSIASERGKFIVKDDAEITLGDYGTLSGTEVTFQGGKTVLDGTIDKEAILRAEASLGKAGEILRNATLIFENNTLIDVKGQGVILSPNTEFNGGNINVDGKLTVAGKANAGATVLGSLAQAGGTFRFSGGTLTVGEKGIVDFVTGGMNLSANAGGIDGTLHIVEAGTVGATAGVYTTNLKVDQAVGSHFSVQDLALAIGQTGTGSVDVGGTLVVKGGITAQDSGKTGLLAVGENGRLTANADSFIQSVDFDDNWNINYVEVNGTLANAVKNSAGTISLNGHMLNAKDPGKTLNMTTAQLAKLKSDLGLTQGARLQLLGVVVGDQLNLTVDENGDVDVSVTNPSATVIIDTDGNDTNELVFEKDVSVKELALENGNSIDTIILKDDAMFTGPGDPTSPIITGGKKPNMDLVAHGNLNLGIAGNNDRQGGLVGDITFAGTRDPRIFDVVDGRYTAGNITVAPDAPFNLRMNVFKSYIDGPTTSLNARSIDFSGMEKSHYADIAVSNATMNVCGDIRFNGNEKGGLSLENNAKVTAKAICDAATVSVLSDSVLEANEIVMAGGRETNIVVGGTVNVGKLDLGEGGGFVLVGDQNRRGALVVREAALRGGTLFADPAWSNYGHVSASDATTVMIEKFANNTTDGDIIVGRNAHLVYGAQEPKWMLERISEAGVWGPGENRIGSAVGIVKPLTIGRGHSLVVDGSLTAGNVTLSNGATAVRPIDLNGNEFKTAGNSAYFARDSLLIVDAKSIGGGAAISFASEQDGVKGVMKAEEGAKLYMYNVQGGKVYSLVDNVALVDGSEETIGKTAWNTADILQDSFLTKIRVYSEASQQASHNVRVLAAVEALSANEVYDNKSDGASNIVDEVYENSGSSPGSTGPSFGLDSDNPGARFVFRATSVTYNGDDPDRHMATIEGATQIASVGGAPLTSFNVMRLNHDALRKRFSFSAGLIPHPYGHGHEEPETPFGSTSALGSYNIPSRDGKRLIALWASPVYQHSRVSGVKIGPFENKLQTNLGGANVGADFDLGSNVRFGLVGNIGGGKSKTRDTIFARTQNSFDYLGLSAYAAWSTCNLSIIADGGYTRFSHELTQDNWLGGRKNRADVKNNGWDVGLTVEGLLVTGMMDIVPHASVRYEGLTTRGHDIRSDDGVMFTVDSKTQHAISIPLGVTFSKDFRPSCSTRITPYGDLGAVINASGKYYRPAVRIPGFSKNTFRSQVLDSASFKASVGVNAQRGHLFTTLNYDLQSSSTQTSHSLWANIGYNF